MTGRATSALVVLMLAGTAGIVAIGWPSPTPQPKTVCETIINKVTDHTGHEWWSCASRQATVTTIGHPPICHGDTNIGRIICDNGKTYPLVRDGGSVACRHVENTGTGAWTCGASISDPRIATTDRAEICGKVDGLSYSRRHRALLTEEDRRADFERSGVPWSEHRYYELDHIVPLCLGGADVPENRHAQRWLDARVKDNLEKHACKEVCAGRLPPETAQGWFLGDWKAAYRQQFGVEP